MSTQQKTIDKTVIPDCKHFNGYKPCFPGHNCLVDGCKDPQPFGTKILIINLDICVSIYNLLFFASVPSCVFHFSRP